MIAFIKRTCESMLDAFLRRAYGRLQPDLCFLYRYASDLTQFQKATGITLPRGYLSLRIGSTLPRDVTYIVVSGCEEMDLVRECFYSTTRGISVIVRTAGILEGCTIKAGRIHTYWVSEGGTFTNAQISQLRSILSNT